MTQPDPKKPLEPREESILKTLIETYLQEGEPVGSRLLAKRYPESLSSATIRNVLSDLEEESFVAQPHTSAGRVPTERAYRYYIDRWLRALEARGPGPELEARLSEAMEGLDSDPETWARHASRVLSEVMQGVCVALPHRLEQSRLTRLEFVSIGSGRVVAVWVGSQGEVEHRVMDDPSGCDAAVLIELGNFATAHFAGLTLPELQARLLEFLGRGLQEGRDLGRRLHLLASRWGQEPQPGEGQVMVAGLGQLGSLPEFGDLLRFRGLVAAFEEQERLARLLNAFADRARADVHLLLGSENPYLTALPLATLVRTLELGPGATVTFALVGPLRMDYPRVLGGLRWWSRQVALRTGQG
ncbi:MAG TPA: heat-inducible transcriptional repressor HrcA [Holophagaceae bacterium]|nr:heat-inducible transcriptional repressor HrcA [Holophagaceae bacterium]